VLIADPDAPGRRERLERSLAGRLVALGPTVAAVEAPLSWARAARCARLAQAGVLPSDRLVFTQDTLGPLALFADPEALGELARQRLEPLATQTAASRARLEATLLSWLRWQGNVPAVAAELHVHAQTVRYRLGRLRECFGGQLDQPDVRFELELALRGIQLAGPAGLAARHTRALAGPL
jgi:DNA-binding PucR family transcriptional regulator